MHTVTNMTFDPPKKKKRTENIISLHSHGHYMTLYTKEAVILSFRDTGTMFEQMCWSDVVIVDRYKLYLEKMRMYQKASQM